MRLAILLALPVAALAACAPAVPDSGAGVGFGNYSEYLRQREAALAGQAPAPTPVTPPAGATPGAPVGALIGSPVAPAGPGAPVAPVTGAPIGTVAGAAPVAAVAGGSNAGLSDEQDFDAVAARETIQSDRERLEGQRQQYVVVEPTAVPERAGSAPNIVEYALSTRHDPGAKLYNRFGIRLTSVERACARYEAPDRAQEAFLARGGPERDPLGLDPDGDGFACGWDPRPFRAAVQ